MNKSKYLKIHPEVTEKFKQFSITWDGKDVIKEKNYKGIELIITTAFNKKSKNALKQTQKRIDEIQSKEIFIEHIIDQCLNRYSLLGIDEIKEAFKGMELKANSEKKTELDFYQEIVKELDLKAIQKEITIYDEVEDYPDIFYKARKRKRKIIAYLGETNSGKTFHALSEIANSFSSAYLAPLRLLAYENYDYLNSQNIKTNLITGEERRLEHDTPDCISSTVECFNFNRDYETVVIDEIQMMDDKDRGSFFVQALVGANAKNVIVTGPSSYEDRLRNITESMGEEFECHHFQRKSELKPLNKPVDIKEIQPNTAIVVFSRKDIFRVRKKLPKNIRSSFIYGALGHEVRQLQAKRFVDGETDVLITTDAIGMGMNLPIEKILFYKYKKFNGENYTVLDDMLVKQIAGRAGRYGIYNTGYYGALDHDTLKYIKESVSIPLVVRDKPLSVKPSMDYIEVLLEKYELSSILLDWSENEKFSEDSMFSNCSLDNQIEIAKYLERHYPEKVKEYFTLINCPIDYEQDHDYFNGLLDQMFNHGRFKYPAVPDELAPMSQFERFIKHCNLILWFSNQYSQFCLEGPETFQIKLKEILETANTQLDMRLQKSSSRD